MGEISIVGELSLSLFFLSYPFNAHAPEASHIAPICVLIYG